MRNGVHYENLNPLSFLQRSALAYPDKTAVVYNEQSFTYTQLHERTKRLAGALRQAGVGKGDRVAFFVPNLPPMLEGHFGPLSLGAVLVTINTRPLTERGRLYPGSLGRQAPRLRFRAGAGGARGARPRPGG